MPEQVSVRVLFFAAAREASGNVSSVELELPDPADTALLRYKRRKRSYHTCIINTLITRSCVSITPKGHNKTVLVGFSLYLPRITRLLALLSDVPFRLNSFFFLSLTGLCLRKSIQVWQPSFRTKNTSDWP